MTSHALATQAVPIDSIHADPLNAREHPREQIDALKAPLRAFGFDQPIVCNSRTRRIIKGHGRHMAAAELGYTEVPVVFVDEDEQQSAARAIADNAIADQSFFDQDALDRQLDSLKPDFDEAALRRMFAELASEPGSGNGDEVEAEDGTVIASGFTVADMELRPEEHYDYIVLLADNVNDWNRLCTLLNLPDIFSERTGRRVGMGRGARVSQVLELIDGRHRDRDSVEGTSAQHADDPVPVPDGDHQRERVGDGPVPEGSAGDAVAPASGNGTDSDP